MSKYVILGCDHNMNDCIESWTISLTEYGLGIFTGDSTVVLKSCPFGTRGVPFKDPN